jgi:hypothetical protein
VNADPPPSPSFEVVDDLPGEFAERVVEAYHYRAVERFALAVATGDVARQCYERLALHAEAQIDWWLVELWASDLDLVRQALLNRVGAAYAVHDLDPAHAAVPDRLDVVHLDLRPDGSLTGHVGDGAIDLAVVTAAGADRAEAFAAAATGAAVPANRLSAARVVLLADRSAASALPAFA